MSKSEAVIWDDRLFLECLRRKNFVVNFGNTQIHIMRECLFDFPVAFVLQLDSAYTEDISRKMQQLRVKQYLAIRAGRVTKDIKE